MKRKIIVSFICLLLILTSIYSVTGNKIIDKCENSTCGMADKIIYDDIENLQFKDNKGILINKGEPFYGYCAWDPSSVLDEGPVVFDSETPGIITQLAPTSSIDFISGATWTDDDEWYGCEYGANGNSNIWIINSTTGEMILVGSYDLSGTGLSFNGLAYDNISKTMFACSNEALYTVDMATGASTLVGTFNISVVTYMIGIAFDEKGNLFGNEIITDSLYKINTTTGEAMLIGPLGININGAQDMAYDIDNKILYLSAYTISPYFEGALFTCNTTTGFVHRIGQFQGSAQITGFAIPYKTGGGQPPEDEIPPITSHATDPPEPNGENNWYVTSIKVIISPTDDDSGVAWTNYSLNNGKSWETHYGPDPFEFIVGEGENILLYNSVDNAGNEESLKGPFNLNVDTVKPDKRWSSYYAIAGPVVLAIICIGGVRDGLSGVDRVEFYLNDTFHHKMDVSVWPVGIWCPIFWFHTNPGPEDVCSGIVYDKAGNWETIKPQSVPNFINTIKNRK